MSFFQKLKSLNPAVFLTLMTGAGALFTLIFLAVTGNQPQVYSDVIAEWTSKALSNKSAEMFLAYFLPLAGIAAYACYYAWKPYREKGACVTAQFDTTPLFILELLGFVTLLVFGLGGNCNFTLIALCLFAMAVYRFDKQEMLNDIIFFLLSLFTVYALYSIYVWCGGNVPFNKYVALGMVLVWSGAVCLKPSGKAALFQKSILIMQIILPALLLIYVSDRYLLNGDIITVKPLLRVRLFVYGVMAGLIILGIVNLKKYWRTPATLNQILSFASCVAVIGFLCAPSSGLQLPADLHHSFENIIAFHQMFQLGQRAFVQYIPVSGMYSIIQGAFFEGMGAGLLSHYYLTEALFVGIISVLVLGLLKWYLKPTALFLVAILLIRNDLVYVNRSLFMLPIMLLLSWPKLIENKNLWLKAWLLTGLFQGLYYPVYGAAVCSAFLPLGIYQAVTFITSGQLRKESQKNGFLLKWGVCFLPVLLAVPWLKGTYQHIRMMGAQTLLADGISRFGQQLPFFFLPVMPLDIRLMANYLLTFLFPAVLIWTIFAFALYVARINKYEKINRGQVRDGCIVLSLVILPLVAFSYTMVRLDIDPLFARNTGVLMTMAVMLVVYALAYGRSVRVKQGLLGMALVVLAATQSWHIVAADGKLHPYITLPKDTVQIERGSIPKSGEGFLKEDLAQILQRPVLPVKMSVPYFGMPVFGLYYIHDMKGASVLESLTLKGYGAVQETVDLLKKYPALVYSPLVPLDNYYWYHYLLTSGAYVWQPAWQVLRPTNGQVPLEEVKQMHRTLPLGEDIFENKTFAAWGQSMESLRPLFSVPTIEFTTQLLPDGLQVIFTQPLDGDTADFLYLEFDEQDKYFEYALYDMAGWHKLPANLGLAKYFVKKNYNPQRRVEICWTDESGAEHNLFGGMDKGKLLIPLGAVAHWLLNDHSSLQIRVTDNALPADFPPVKKIEFLKLREVH